MKETTKNWRKEYQIEKKMSRKREKLPHLVVVQSIPSTHWIGSPFFKKLQKEGRFFIDLLEPKKYPEDQTRLSQSSLETFTGYLSEAFRRKKRSPHKAFESLF